MNLLRQSSQLLELVELAVYEAGQVRAEGEKAELIDVASGVTTFTARGATPAARVESVQRGICMQILELVIVPDGSDYFGEIDRTELVRLLDDPLSSNTRGARRNTLVAASVLFLIGATRTPPAKVPGFELDLTGHPWIIAALVLGVAAYQGASFILYARTDAVRLAIAGENVEAQRKALASNVSSIDEAVRTLNLLETPGGVADALANWLDHAKAELARLGREWTTIGHQRAWDLWMPAPFVVVALLTFLIGYRW
jgi:hypothetical protein